jgi:hypothetical protein
MHVAYNYFFASATGILVLNNRGMLSKPQLPFSIRMAITFVDSTAITHYP